MEDGTEKVIKTFNSVTTALKWSAENNIMGSGMLNWTLRYNDYYPEPAWKFPDSYKYKNRHLYRFSKIEPDQ